MNTVRPLPDYTDDELVEELVRRGWRHKESRVPLGTYKGSPTFRARQLQRTYEPEEP